MDSYQFYNTSIDGKSPLFTYTPSRAAGAVNALEAWTLTNPSLVADTSYTTNLSGATVEIQWTGTSIWLYGRASASSSYGIIRSWSEMVWFGDEANGTEGVLFSEAGLSYGSYTLALSVSKGPVTISGATITVGMGDAGSSLQSHNQSAATGSGANQVNPFFQTNSRSFWSSLILDGSQSILRTSNIGDSITFTVQSSVSFAIYGTTAPAYGEYNISVDPLPDNLPPTAQYNASTAFEVLDALKFLATGLDETKNYTVTMTNAERNKTCDIGQVVLHSAVRMHVHFVLKGQTNDADEYRHHFEVSGSATSGRQRLNTGDIVGIVLGCVASVLIFWATAVALRQRRRRRRIEYSMEKPSTPLYREYRYKRAARHSPVRVPGIDLIDPDIVVIGGERELMTPELEVTPFMKTYTDLASPACQSTHAEQPADNSLPNQLTTERSVAVPAENADRHPRVRPPSYKAEWMSSRTSTRTTAQQPPSSYQMKLEGEPAP
ncbi:uncharacterized protein B0H18DRAFT_1118458 [Fomitopsis serialis]|uniref:uncharacterized protein n=1 Tax=Fomitopsis serialis TaxID=139415 RepID=UPI0020083410|nr:uncharacterized protein B0H18DRAFT_1118458 [Neoantrodia serialis]KAH9927662.1 hypothetical protein B0H18DRAFT_1118458 [Neoantrodia serialis]